MSKKPLMSLCLICGNGHAKPVRNRSLSSRLLSLFGLHRFDCQVCGMRFMRFVDSRLFEALER